MSGIVSGYLASEWLLSGLTIIDKLLLHECTILNSTPKSRHSMILNEQNAIKAYWCNTRVEGFSGDLLEAFRAKRERSRRHQSVDVCAFKDNSRRVIVMIECKYRKGPVECAEKEKAMRQLFLQLGLKFNHMKVLFSNEGLCVCPKRYVVFSTAMAPLFLNAYNSYCVGRGRKMKFRIVSTSQLKGQLSDVLK